MLTQDFGQDPSDCRVTGADESLRWNHRQPVMRDSSWYALQPTARFDEATVQRYRAELLDAGLALPTLNQRLSAIRALAQEAADNHTWFDAQLAIGIGKVKGIKSAGTRIGNWLTQAQAKALLDAPAAASLKGVRDTRPSWPCCSAATCGAPSWPINTIEGWFEPQFDQLTLDAAARNDIGVLMPFESNQDWPYENPNVQQSILDYVSAYVERYKDDPAVRMWAPGNEDLHRILYPHFEDAGERPRRARSRGCICRLPDGARRPDPRA
jgi:hypothetical protein